MNATITMSEGPSTEDLLKAFDSHSAASLREKERECREWAREFARLASEKEAEEFKRWRLIQRNKGPEV
jgi:hypothetical protein